MSIILKYVIIIFIISSFDRSLYGQFRFIINNGQSVGFSIANSGQLYLDTTKDSLPPISTWKQHSNNNYGISCGLPPGFILIEKKTISDSSLIVRDTLHEIINRDAIVIRLSRESFYRNAQANSFGIDKGDYDIINDLTDSIFFSNPKYQHEIISQGRMGMQARAEYFELEEMKCIRGDNSVGKYGNGYEGLEEVKRAYASKKVSKNLSLVFYYESIESYPNPIKEHRFYQIISSVKYSKK